MPFIQEPVFLWPLWSLKLFSTAKEPFVTKISVDFLFSEISGSEKNVVVLECDDFLVPYYVWRLTLKPIKICHLWCSDPRVIANQIIFHNFWKITWPTDTISNGESQPPLLRFFLWGGGGGGGGGGYTGYPQSLRFHFTELPQPYQSWRNPHHYTHPGWCKSV